MVLPTGLSLDEPKPTVLLAHELIEAGINPDRIAVSPRVINTVWNKVCLWANVKGRAAPCRPPCHGPPHRGQDR